MPLSDFSSHDPDFSAEQVAECARRRVARHQHEGRVASLDPVTKRRAMENFRFRFDTADPNSVMSFSPATGAFNAMAPKLEMRVESEKLVAEFAFASHYESSPDAVQGGMVATCFDQLLAFGWVETVDGEKFSARGSCFHGDVKVSEAEALTLGKYEMPVVGA